jgi:AP2 domain
MGEFFVNSRKHGLKAILVDDEDVHLLKKYRWSITRRRNIFYAVSRGPVFGKLSYLHRIILNAENKTVDHKNGNGLDNRRINLRVCSQGNNVRNKRKTKGLSKYKGVYWSKRDQRWQASIRVDYKNKFLGSFGNEEDAARAYDTAALTYFGEFARLNFTKEKDT